MLNKSDTKLVKEIFKSGRFEKYVNAERKREMRGDIEDSDEVASCEEFSPESVSALQLMKARAWEEYETKGERRVS